MYPDYLKNANAATGSSLRQILIGIPGAVADFAPIAELSGAGELQCVPLHLPHPIDQMSRSAADTGPNVRLETVFEISAEITEADLLMGLGSDQGDFSRLLHTEGIDGLGWYSPFHFPNRQHGIYITLSGVIKLALFGFTALPHLPAKIDLTRRLKAAFEAIHHHEMFHFATEVMTANLEMLLWRPVYLPAHQFLLAMGHKYFDHEEGCANAYMLRKCTRDLNLKKDLKNIIQVSPPGYNNGVLYAKDFYNHCSDLVFDYRGLADESWAPGVVPIDLSGLYTNISDISKANVPVFLVRDIEVGKFILQPEFISSISCVEETKRFTKSLLKLGIEVKARWQKTKQKLAISTAFDGLDFKPWSPGGPNCFSVRIDRGMRAHLRFSSGTFFAEDIGTHDSMGH